MDFYACCQVFPAREQVFYLQKNLSTCTDRPALVHSTIKTGRSGKVFGPTWLSGKVARHFRAQPSTGEIQESMNNVTCRRDMTEILSKEA